MHQRVLQVLDTEMAFFGKNPPKKPKKYFLLEFDSGTRTTERHVTTKREIMICLKRELKKQRMACSL